MRWTYDPLQLANAHLNLQALGAAGVAYHVNHYGTLGGINGDLPSDRVTVSWDLVTQGADRPAATLSIDVPPATADDIAASNQAALTARLAVRAELASFRYWGGPAYGLDRTDVLLSGFLCGEH